MWARQADLRRHWTFFHLSTVVLLSLFPIENLCQWTRFLIYNKLLRIIKLELGSTFNIKVHFSFCLHFLKQLQSSLCKIRFVTISKKTHFVSDLINQAGFPSRAGPIYQLIKELTGARQETITQWYIETPAQINVQPLGPALPSPAAITTHYHQTNDTIPLMVSVSTSRLNLHFHINPTFFWSFIAHTLILLLPPYISNRFLLTPLTHKFNTSNEAG